MKALLATLLLTLSLAANAIEVTGEIGEQDVQKWKEVTCSILENDYECPVGIPAVGLGPMEAGYWGLYFGMNFILINEDLRNPQWGTYGEAILAHEIAHWIVRKNDSNYDSCDSEAVAWRVFNAIVRSHGRDDLAVDDWIVRYPNCQ